jgi:hypothetical protein
MKYVIGIMAILFFMNSNLEAVDAPFNIYLKLFKPIQLTKIADLDFGEQVQGTAADIVIATSDAGAAEFNATGGKNRAITRSVVEASVNLTAAGVVDPIAVDTFTVDGPTAFDGSGDADALKIGATARILAASEDGDYSGAATFRVVYQ